KVLILFTPNYLRKCLERRASVGVEYSIISAYKFRSVDAEEKVIPILCKGTCETSIPDYFQQFIYIDMTNPTLFENQFNSLVMSIYGEPTVSRPPLGKPPSFRSVD
ncbi:MAG TPA: hypothetical protein VK616_09325, partial [Flavitalea sp.]|nr:hypothetical protein [Flavitalea sp.]